MIGRRVLITGEVGVGKTRLTRRLLKEALSREVQKITVIDMAPEVKAVNGVLAGGRLLEEDELGLRYLGPRQIRTPRLSAKNAEELISLAEENRSAIEPILDQFIHEPTEILFVNDVSIYLQRGNLERLWSAFTRAKTVVANGYIGEKLKGDYGVGLSPRERRLMEELASRMDLVIPLHGEELEV